MSWSLEGVSLADFAASGLAVAVDSSLRGAILIGAAGAFAVLARSAPARWRHGLWLSAFVGVSALPALAVLDVGPAALARTGGGGELALLGAWLIGFGVLSVRQAVASRRLRRNLVGSVDGPGIPGARVRIGGTIGSPVTFGLRSVVLLPSHFGSWPPASQRQVLLHEGAHVARRDWLTQRLATLLCHVFWFHPLVWVARRMLVLEAERAADEAVLRAGERPSDYAQLLLDRSSCHSPAPALAARRWLELRVRSLLGPAPGARWPGALGVVALLTLTPLLSEVKAAPEPPAPHCDTSAVALAEPVEPKPIPEVDGDTAKAAAIHAELNRRVLALSPPRLDAARSAASRLVRNCPYNRAGAGMPVLLDEVLRPHYPLLQSDYFRGTSPALHDRLTVLQAALAEHVRLVDSLGLTTLPTPQPGDYLAQQVVWRRAAVPGGGARIDEALVQLDAVMGLVEGYDEATKARIDESLAVVEQATVHRWPMKGELIAYRTTLVEIAAMADVFSERGAREVRPEFAALGADCRRLAEVLDRYVGMYC